MLFDLPRTVRDWPVVGDTCEVSEEEASRLTDQGWAEYVNDPEEDDDDPLYEEPSDEELDYDGPDEDDDFGYGASGSDDDMVVEDEEVSRPPRSLIVKKPRTVDPKSKWLEYARSHGFTGDDSEITKNQLIARYGD